MQTTSIRDERAFSFIPVNQRQAKPRTAGITEIRGPYYTPVGKHYLEDLFDSMGDYVDTLKFAGGSFVLMPRKALQELVDFCHEQDVLISTGGFIERVLTYGPQAVSQYIAECRQIGFDIIEVSTGFITIPVDDVLRLIEEVHKAGMKAKPEVGIQFGAGGTTAAAELESEGTQDVEWAVQRAKRFLDAGAYMIMIESEGITESVKAWRTDAPAKFANALGLEKVMFEAAEPEVFQWYVKNFGPDVNLFVDHSQIVELEALRSGIWGTKSLWGRVATFKGSERLQTMIVRIGTPPGTRSPKTRLAHDGLFTKSRLLVNDSNELAPNMDQI